MVIKTVLHNQSILDISIQEYGTPVGAVSLALENQLALTDELQPGQVVKIPDLDAKNTDVANYYAKKSIWPSTAMEDEVLDIIDNVDPCNYCKCFT